MFKNKDFNYKVYTDGKEMTVAVAKFAGKEVKAVVRTRGGDVYDAEKGAEIAKAKCALKIAEKRVKNADAQVLAAQAAFAAAKAVLQDKLEYQAAANEDFTEKATAFVKYND